MNAVAHGAQSRCNAPPSLDVAAPPRFTGAVHQAFKGVQQTLAGAGLQQGDTVLVACSGGADSLALAACAAVAAREVGATTRRRGFRVKVGAVVVDHQLQARSRQVAETAAQQCRELGLNPVEVVAVDVGHGGGMEAAARAARYAALDAAAARLGAARVLLGHTLDDQAEGVLLGLARGSGSRSLAGMAAQTGLCLRPFLQVRRATTERICDLFGVEPWEDPSNSQLIATRNRVRAKAIPALRDAVGHDPAPALARTAEILREDADALDQLAQQLFDKSTAAESCAGATNGLAETGGSVVVLDVATLAAAPAAVRHRAVRLAAIQAGVVADRMSRAQAIAVDALVTDWHGQAAHQLPGNVAARRAGGALRFE